MVGSPGSRRKTEVRQKEQASKKKKNYGNEAEPFLYGKADSPKTDAGSPKNRNAAALDVDEAELRRLQKMYRKKARDVYHKEEEERPEFGATATMLTIRKTMGGVIQRKRKTIAPAPAPKVRKGFLKREPTEEEALLLGFVHGIPDDMQEFAVMANSLECVMKLNMGHHEELTFEDVEELCKAIGTNSDGKVELKQIEIMLTHLLEPPCSKDEVKLILEPYIHAAEHNWEGVEISDAELFVCFTKGPHVKKFIKLREQHHSDIMRNDLRSHLEGIVDRHDYLMTFPMTIFNMCVFVFIVIGHLRIFERSQLENALEEFVNGRDPTETCDQNVDDMDSWWEYLGVAGLRATFGKVENSTYDSSFKHCMLASRNILIGDVQLRQVKFDGATSTNWLLHSSVGASYLESNPGDYWSAAKAAAVSLQASGADHADIYINELRFNTYNEYAQMFTLTKVNVRLGRYGDVYSKISSSSVSCVAYHYLWLYVADGLFALTTSMMVKKEVQDFIALVRLGMGFCEALRDFADFWQFIDWSACLIRGVTIFAWVLCMMTMLDPKLQDLIDSSSGKLKVDVMALSTDTLDTVMDQIYKLRMTYLMLQLGCAVLFLLFIARFFKAFNANPRLKVVQNTFDSMKKDFAHFAIVFATIFLPFVVVAHILFGQDVEEFASLLASVNTGFYMLFGEFGFYADIAPSHFEALLPSGKPLIVFSLWYVSYMILVFLVLLNMLVAIILKHSTEVDEQVKKLPYAPPIWKQAKDYRAFKKDTKKFLSLKNMLLELDNDSAPAHEPDSVCAHSLMAAWPNMTPDQAIWLMCNLEEERKLAKEASDLANDDENIQRETDKEFAQILDNLCAVSFNEKEKEEAEDIERKIHGMARSRRRYKPKSKDANADKVTSEREELMKQLSKMLREARSSIDKMVKDQDSLVRKVKFLGSATQKKPSKSKSKSPERPRARKSRLV